MWLTPMSPGTQLHLWFWLKLGSHFKDLSWDMNSERGEGRVLFCLPEIMAEFKERTRGERARES